MLATTPSFADDIYTNDLPYDHVALNSNTWQEVDMVYWSNIHGHYYKNTVALLRPKAYLSQYHMNQIGSKVTLTLPEIGLNHTQVTITAIKSAPAFKRCHKNICSQVIGLFKHYATNVKTYRFKDLKTGKISMVHATTNHPFYVKNKHQFLPISEVTVNDELVGHNNETIKLLCYLHHTTHCGITYNNQKPTLVYNLEVYQQHNYTVGQSSILVHNPPCRYKCETCRKEFPSPSLREIHMRTHTGEKSFVCTEEGCGKSFSQNNSLTRHMKVHTGEKPFECPEGGCGRSFARKDYLTRHMKVHTGEKPFECLDCGKSFAQKSNLTVHMKTHDIFRDIDTRNIATDLEGITPSFNRNDYLPLIPDSDFTDPYPDFTDPYPDFTDPYPDFTDPYPDFDPDALLEQMP